MERKVIVRFDIILVLSLGVLCSNNLQFFFAHSIFLNIQNMFQAFFLI